MKDEKIQTSKGEVPLTYKRGFEMGYWLQRGNYEKLDNFIKSAKPYRDFQNGLEAGSEHAQKEFFQSAVNAVEQHKMEEINKAIMEGKAENVDPIYKKGFEHGYWLQKGGSKEIDKAIEGSKNHEGYSSGLIAGRSEANREKVRDRLNDIHSNKSKDKGPEMS